MLNLQFQHNQAQNAKRLCLLELHEHGLTFLLHFQKARTYKNTSLPIILVDKTTKSSLFPLIDRSEPTGFSLKLKVKMHSSLRY